MSYSTLILADNPDLVWAFDDVAETSSVSTPISFLPQTASYYNASIVASATNVVDVPIVYGGGTAMSLRSSAGAVISLPLINNLSEVTSYQEHAIELWLRIDKARTDEITIFKKRNFDKVGLFLKENYLIFRYGTSSSYIEAAYGLADLTEPTHIVLNYSKSAIQLIVNGVTTLTQNNGLRLPIDTSHSTNNFLDFYGQPSYDFVVDSVAYYSHNISPAVAKRHYVYGLGKNVKESIFFILGGDYYNFSTNSTRKAYYAYWDSPKEWKLTRTDNLLNNKKGITTRNFNDPVLYTSDSNITKTSNKIKFSSSAGNTNGTYIDINDVPSIMNGLNNALFVKVKFDGDLPASLDNQTIMSIGKDPLTQLVSFDLFNNSGSYVLRVYDFTDSSSTSFSIPNITSSPTAYIGMQYDGNPIYYFALSGSAVQSASTGTYSGSVYGNDLLSDYFPPDTSMKIRFGSAYTYDDALDLTTIPDVSQFYGTFEKFIVFGDNFSASTYSTLDALDTMIYGFEFNTSLNRFKTKTYGNLNFFIHGSKLGQFSPTGSSFLTANRFEFGYPDVLSGSQVKIYATLLDYNDNVVNAKTLITPISSFEWMNYININTKYLRFDIDIYADDTNYYRPFIRNFKAETYQYSTGSYVDIYDNGGDRIRIYSSSAGHAFIPEFDETPSVFLSNTSGVKVYRNYVDVQFSPESRPTNIEARSDLVLFLDSRFNRGKNRVPYLDAASGVWYDRSNNSYNASATIQYPEFRIQSANLLRNNFANGGEDGTMTGITGSAATITLSSKGAINGFKSFAITPTGTSDRSYAFFVSNNGTSFQGGVFASGTYTAVATITLTKPQEDTSLNANARKLMIVPYIGSSSQTPILSNQAPNTKGSHSVSVTFTLDSTITGTSIRLMNGSSSVNDIVYFDNIGIYSGSTITSWKAPYDLDDDRPVFKFSSSAEYFTSSFSLNQPMTIYTVVRGFGGDNAFIGKSASAPSLYASAGSYTMFAGSGISGSSVNTDFNVLIGVYNGNSSSLYINDTVVAGSVGSGSITNTIDIGHRLTPAGADTSLKGDIALVMIFNTAHNSTTISNIKSWIDNSFNV